jgi:hypothetical protein
MDLGDQCEQQARHDYRDGYRVQTSVWDQLLYYDKVCPNDEHSPGNCAGD